MTTPLVLKCLKYNRLFDESILQVKTRLCWCPTKQIWIQNKITEVPAFTIAICGFFGLLTYIPAFALIFFELGFSLNVLSTEVLICWILVMFISNGLILIEILSIICGPNVLPCVNYCIQRDIERSTLSQSTLTSCLRKGSLLIVTILDFRSTTSAQDYFRTPRDHV